MALTIGQVARATGVSARTIRFYETAGVLPAPDRAPSGYRQYGQHGVEHLRFVRRARALGLPLRRLKALSAALRDGRGPVRPRVREAVEEHLAAVRARIRELRALDGQLARILAAMDRRPRSARPGACRCLEAPAAPGPRGRRGARGR